MTPHPATYTDALLPIMAGLLSEAMASATGPAKILDPFAGTGEIARLRAWLPPSGAIKSPEGPQAEFYGYEIEPEWAEQARAAGCTCTTGDSRQMHVNSRTLMYQRCAPVRPTAIGWPITTTRKMLRHATRTATCWAGR